MKKKSLRSASVRDKTRKYINSFLTLSPMLIPTSRNLVVVVLVDSPNFRCKRNTRDKRTETRAES